MSDYKQIMDRLYAKALHARIPFDAKIELTHRCNLSCNHCYVNQPVSSSQNELTTQEWFRVLKEIKTAGALHLLFTGGEVFVRKDFIDIYTYAKELGFIVTIYTNATLIKNEHIALLKKFPPYVIEISLYGSTASVYEQVTNVSGSYNRCIENIERLAAAGIRLKVKTMLLKDTAHDLQNINDYANSLNIPFNFDGIIAPRIDGDPRPLLQRLEPEDIVSYDIATPSRKQELSKIYSEYTLNGCKAGISSFLVEPNGTLSLCVLYRAPRINLRTTSFKAAWKLLGEKRASLINHPAECRDCAQKNLCWCPGIVEKDKNMSDTFMCRLAKERVRRIINHG